VKKILVGIAACIPIAMGIGFINIHFLLESKILIIFLIGIIASYYQAEYNPLKIDNNGVDKGTVLQIIWTVYITQMLALLELVFKNSDQAFAYDPGSIIFLSIALGGLYLRSWAYVTLGKFFTMHLETKDDQVLIETGPYRYLRHPSYTGAFLTYTFIPLFLGSYRAAIVSVVLLLFAFHRRITHEEKMLDAHMGEKYRAFCLKKARLLPFIW
jgi:protein-S-isoprenylcysteine O-methyltransferase